MKKTLNQSQKIFSSIITLGIGFHIVCGNYAVYGQEIQNDGSFSLSNSIEKDKSLKVSIDLENRNNHFDDNDSLISSKIQQIEVLGNSVFLKQDLSPIIAEFMGLESSVENLLKLRAEITRLYTKKGYSTSAAFIPKEQDISQGKIKVQVVEGTLEDIIVEGLGRVDKGYIVERLQLSVPLNIYDLRDRLQILQTDPLIEDISAELVTGTAPGLNVLKVQVAEADTFTAQLGSDNNRSPSVGSQRRGLLLTEANLFGNGEQLEASYFNSEGSNSGYLGLSVPLNSNYGTLKVEAGLTFNEVVERPFNLLDLETESRYYQLTFRQPVIKSPFEELALGGTVSRIESEGYLDGFRFPISRGANEDGEVRISAIRFFQEWLRRSNNQFFSLRSQLSFGIDLDNASSLEPNSEFFHWNIQGQYLRQLAPETLLILRGYLQQADQPLLPDEQFRIGGANSVRGYREDFVLSDSGFWASAEVRVPVLRIPDWGAVVQFAPFIDYGIGWNDNEFPLDPSSITSVGLGLRWQQRNFGVDFYWGIPLTTIKEEKRTLQENGLYFNFRWNAF